MWPHLARSLKLDLSATSSQLPTVIGFQGGEEYARVPQVRALGQQHDDHWLRVEGLRVEGSNGSGRVRSARGVLGGGVVLEGELPGGRSMELCVRDSVGQRAVAGVAVEGVWPEGAGACTSCVRTQGTKNAFAGVGKWTFSRVELISGLQLDTKFATTMSASSS